MFERYLTDALTKQFGHLVADLDSEKVRLSAWNGRLVLEDVALRTDALDSFVEHCPFELAYGRIGRLELQVPWSLVGSQLWRRRATKSTPGGEEEQDENCVSIVVSDVNILLTPRRKTQGNSGNLEEEETKNEASENNVSDETDDDNKQKLREQKEKIVQEMLDAQLLSRVAHSSQMTSRWKWVQDWISSLLSKLAVTARNIHIRYEDPGHCMGFMWNTTLQSKRRKRSYREAFTIGITLRKFSVTNTRGNEEKELPENNSGLDTNGPQTVETTQNDGDDDEKDVEKHNHAYEVKNTVASADKLAIYWDSHGCTLMCERAITSKAQQQLAQEYLGSAFAVLNGDSPSHEEFSDETDFNAPHTFLLDPVSPSVQFALVNDTAGIQSPPNGSDKTTTSLSSTKPSSIRISLPPTLFSLSRHILQDIVYLRKSLDVWIHAKKGILSGTTLKRLAALRPLDNACENPRGWWKYAAEATMAFVKAGRHLDSVNNGREESPVTTERRSGWIGLARALAARKRYVATYKEFLFHNDYETSETDDGVVFGPFLPPEQIREKVHQTLLELEDNLSPSEISAFRIAAYKEIVGSPQEEAVGEVAAPYRWKPIGTGATDIATSSACLSSNHRYQMFVEMAQALDTEMFNTEILQMEMRQQSERGDQSVVPGGSIASATSKPAPDPVVWTIALSCAELSLQVNDQQRTKIKSTDNGTDPIVRLSCACVLKSNLYHSGSWNADWSIAALVMEDLAFVNDGMQEMKVLLGPKLNDGGQSDRLYIDGVPFQENVRVSLSRKVEWQKPGSTTHTRIRLSPLEIMYSTVPFEALSRVLATVKTPELTDDYHRMASRVFEWRQRQKQRLLEALAHRGKKILIDVDVTAPVLLIPEIIDRADSPLLVLDLGHLHFSNAAGLKEMSLDRDVATDFDDAWRLGLTNIQVQCTTTAMYRQTQADSDLCDTTSVASMAQPKGPQQVVEGFSLDVAISTKVAEAGVNTRIKVAATLPKLSFNITTSSVRLISRLRSQWSERKHEMTTSPVPKSQQSAFVAESTIHDDLTESDALLGNDVPTISAQNESDRIERQFEFCFSAPLISVKLENDVDRRLKLDERAFVLAEHPSTPIVGVSVRGIGGTFIQVLESGRYSTKFTSKLGSVFAKDHYQSAGIGFEHLLSCFEPSQGTRISPAISNEVCNSEILPTEKDLVLVEFRSEGADNLMPEEIVADKLSVQFHELYVEWNPETIAAIHKALRTPKSDPEAVAGRDENVQLDEFFDAEESTILEAGVVDGDVFFDTLDPSFADFKTPLAKLNRRSTLTLLSTHESTWKRALFVAPDIDPGQNDSNQSSPKPFMVVFNLSKLRVNFNKESRHRRLFTAEMDRTSVTYEKQVSGRSITKAKLGNLIFSDPSSDDNQTLYGQILGLQNDVTGDTVAQQLFSLLEMELVSVPKSRQTVVQRPEGIDDVTSQGVSLCYNDGSVRGYDTHVRARLSPMRFVYLSQLYSEIIDYFFEGIVGYEVLGGDRPANSSSTSVEEEREDPTVGTQERKDDDDPEAVSFTAVDVVIDSPVVLFPVTYRSPHFVKLQTAGIKLSNCFECKARDSDVARWHNNYNISFESIRISSWDGSDLSHSRFEQVGAAISLRWPIGPLASLEDPKWNVNCKIDSLGFSLRRDDYALLQEIVSYNIGEDSRNLDEWNALQNLNPDELERYKQSIMVHYGYDTKDVAPTTYSISLLIPLVSVQFERGGKYIAVAECSNFSYQIKKLSDCVSCQTIKSCIKLVHPAEQGNDNELLISSKGLNNLESLPELTYMSKTDADGNNVKSLEIKDACIYMVYPAWTTLSDFFSDLPTAEVLTAEQVGLSVQIGDRWYKISGSLANKKEGSVAEAAPRQFSWIGKEKHYFGPDQGKEEAIDEPSSFQFRVLLSSPHIIISSSPTEAQSISLVLRLRHLDFLHKHDGAEKTLTKSLFLHDLELYTSSQANVHDSLNLPNESSLIHPWSLSATQSSCSKQLCNCSSHSVKIAADVLKARVSFSDMVIVVEVCLRFLADIRQRKLEASDPVATSKSCDVTAGNEIDLNGSALQNGEKEAGTPVYQVMTLDMDGFELLLVDDSGRQFVKSQELIRVMIGRILLCREENALPLSELERHETSRNGRTSRRMTLCLQGLDLLDCLQPNQSPFQLVASTRWGSFEGQGKTYKNALSRPKMQWELFTMQNAAHWGFLVSPSLIERTNPDCFANLSDGPRVPDDLDTLTLRSFEDGVNLRTYSVTMRALMMQYNPSTVIALQRFLGRFRKRAVKSLHLFNEEIDNLMQASTGPEVNESTHSSNEVVKVEIQLQRLAVFLNKEHLNRRLLRVVLGDCTAALLRNDEAMALEGGIGDVSAWDCDLQEQTISNANQNMCVLRTSSSAEGASQDESQSPPFLNYRYCTFSGRGAEKLADVPQWLHSHVAGKSETIDDFLEVQIGTIETIYLRERTEEIVDYLSNGLPGKGMGMTSKAAQDFVKTRIRTKSFLHVGISSPVVIVPKNDLANSGLQLRLGDIDLKSWFEGGSSEGRIDDIDLLSGVVAVPVDNGYTGSSAADKEEQSHWWRMLSLQITSFTAGMFVSAACSTVDDSSRLQTIDALNGPLDVSLFLQKSAWHNRKMSLRCHFSLVDMTLKYSQYCLLCAVVDGNVGKKIDKDKWDNIEKAYDLEVMEEAEGHLSQSVQPRPVEYASGARHVRFGPKGALSPDRPRNKTSVEGREGLVDVKITLDGFNLKLHRDDLVKEAEDNEAGLSYDMILLKVHLVEVSIDNNISEEFSFQLALYRIALFDLGDQGRLARERFQVKEGNRLEPRQPCAFAVLVEGYESAEDDSLPQGLGPIKTKEDMEPQLLITVDKVPASAVGTIGSIENQISQEDGSSTVTLAKVMLNFLSVNALIRPFTELVSFLTLAWPSPLPHNSETNGSAPVRSNSTDTETEVFEADSGPQKDKKSSSSGSRLQVKLVAHYPRIFFVADESDAHSRALVLRGLAVVNAGRTIKSSASNPHPLSLSDDVRTDFVLDAQLHSLESYINPDVSRALRLQQRHKELLDGVSVVLPLYASHEEVDDVAVDHEHDELGVALLQPVTAGIEYGKISRSRFPSKRFFSINIEPISTMVSFDDLQLIEAVFNRWVTGRKDAKAAKVPPSQQSGAKVVSQAPNDNFAQPSVYEVVFRTNHLGLGLKQVGDRIVVDDVWETESTEIQIGDTLARIEGQQVPQLSLGNIVDQLASTPRPTRIAFVRPGHGTSVAVTHDVELRAGVGAAEDVLEETTSQPSSVAQGNKFTLYFKCGIPNGLSLEQSCVVCIPVVTKVEPSITIAVLQDKDAEACLTKRLPRTGALVIQLNGLAVTESNYWDALSFIGMNGNRDGTVEQNMAQNNWYSLTFMEIESNNWGNLDSLDLSLQGAALTFIDDLNGKDMPLLRGTLKAVETHFQSGVGIKTTMLDRVKELPLLAHYSSYSNIGADSSITLRTVARTTIEYFHARKALYEPLLEPSQLCCNYECHSGNKVTGAPSQIALELSDSMLKSKSKESPEKEDDVHMICVNVSDSSMEVLAKALREWKLWREMIQDNTAVSEPDPTLHVSQSALGQDATGTQDDVVQTSNEARKKDFEARAATAAFLFAQKRGAERSGKDESSKPFVFKNRTGVSIAFVQQNANDKHDLGQRKKPHKHPFVGDYAGLDQYDRCDVIEVADGEDAKFQMDFMSSVSKPYDLTKKVRTYDGKLPCIKVAIQSVAGVWTDTLSDLQVQRAGSFIRNLSVHKAGSTENRFVAEYSVPIVWKVEVEDNRRVVTLSSAVRVVSLNALVVEIGVRRCHVLEQKSRFGEHPHVGDGIFEKVNGDENKDIQLVGVSLPDSPFYLPLWLAMRLEYVQVYVRPRFGHSSQYQWGHQSVLQFSSKEVQQTRASSGNEWVWKDTIDEGFGSIKCEAKENGAPAAFLSCFTAGHVSKDPVEQLQEGGDAEDVVTNEIISVSIDAGLSIRNLLPVGIEWEAGHGSNAGSPSAVDGSGLRLQESAVESLALLSGGCVEVYACNFKTETLRARFKLQNETSWSAWTLVSSPPATESIKEKEPASEKAGPNIATAFQTNVHVEDEFGVPIVFGVRVVKKIAKFDWDISSVVCYGIEVIIYAELWITNNTPLPLSFGCPSHQIHAEGKRDEDKANATKFSAEAALMEIASVLELGENGTEIDTRHASIATVAGEIFLIPRQEGPAITEEIFEYQELTAASAAVKRRWWASDNYWNLRNKGILELNDSGQSWHWSDPKWKIDSSGQVDASSGGWESCEDLLGSGEGPFSGQRQFVPSHPFRRRRWFRTRASICRSREILPDRPGSSRSAGNLLPGLQAFHQPIRDSFSKAQKKRRWKKRGEKERDGKQGDDTNEKNKNKIELDEANTYAIAVKCGDGRWSVPAIVSSIGSSHGSLQVFASRWPSLTNITSSQPAVNTGILNGAAFGSSEYNSTTQYEYGKAPLNPTLFELVYQVSEIDGEWGEFSRHLLVSSRFFVRNDSKNTAFEIKQSGATEESAIRLSPGETAPFHWSDFRLPRLVCVRPADEVTDKSKVYKWSGGFDACKLGYTVLLVRWQATANEPSQRRIRSIRTLVELRPGTGGTGINISFKEENEDGDGALYRIENRSTFNVWMAQDGVLANPSTTGPHDRSESDGDLIRPGERKSFGLDVPYRQGKYAGRQAATMAELLHVRVGLAPLSSRAGIETTKVIGLSTIGENIRLKPSKLVTILSPEQRRVLERVRVLGVTTADGPSRVLKFCMMATPPIENSLGSVLMDSVAFEPPVERQTLSGPHAHDIGRSASVAESLLAARELPTESDAKKQALFGGERTADESFLPFEWSDSEKKTSESTKRSPDTKFAVRVSFSGFLVSLMDSSPSEICTISFSHMNAMAKWNQLRTADASLLLSIGWLQVDNHIPSAPFPVAFCPALEARDVQNKGKGGWQRAKDTNEAQDTPLLFVGIEFAPRHPSGVVCIKSATIAPRSLEISLDLAFLVRLQRFASCVQAHFEQQKVNAGEDIQVNVAAHALQQRAIPLPKIGNTIQEVNSAAQTGVGRQQVYFGAFAVLNFTVFLSVAPARALTAAQAALEGMDAAAIHKAVRKGDLNLGRSAYPLGVVVGRRNKTAQEVVHGVFKSILVDSLIRMDGASLNLAGAFLRNQIFYGSQLVTVIAAHYMYSMRQNVPALLGSMSAIGNPLGLFRGIGDGVHDFVNEPMKGIKKSIQKLDPQYMVDGVARGTGSLARHTVGGFADSAALLTSTFSKNMAVLTLDRRYAQKRDRGNQLRYDEQGDFFLLAGVESGFVKLAQGFIEGVTGVVKAPLRGAEKRGFEGFAKGVGKGLLGLLVKPMIGISDAATDVFIGVKTSVEGDGHHIVARPQQVRPRRALYGRDKQIRAYDLGDAAASALMLRTRIGGQNFLSHLDMEDRVALLSDKRLLLLDSEAQEQLLVKFKHISNVEVHEFEKGMWSILVMLNSPRRNGSEVEVITCKDRHEAEELCSKIKEGMSLLETESYN